MGPYLAKPSTTKSKFQSESSKLGLKFSRCQMQGWRRSMEDAAISELDLGDGNSLFAIFDGHGGPEVALFAERHFLSMLKSCKFYKEGKYYDAFIDTFRRLDEALGSKGGEEELKAIRRKSEATSFNDGAVGHGTGCTACVVLITPQTIITANAGDSRAVLCRGGKAIPLSFDHKPTNQSEYKRIRGAGGTVLNGRINGTLNLSRSLGDLSFKSQKNRSYDQQLVISRPDVSQIPRSPGQDEFILLGCDGIWEKYTNDSQLMISRVIAERATTSDGLGLLTILLDSFLAKDTEAESGCDNMSAILVDFL